MVKERWIRVVVAHDFALFRESLGELLRDHPDVKIVGEASDGREVLEVVETLRPDVLLLKPSMSEMEGLETLSQIREKSPATKVLLIVSTVDRELIFQALQRGARGYLSKTTGTAELVKAIQAAHAGEAWVERDVMGHLLEGFTNGKNTSSRRQSARLLSARERGVTSLVGLGLANKEIGARLGVSEKTVKSHLGSIFRKLHISHRLQLALYALDSTTLEAERPAVLAPHKPQALRANGAAPAPSAHPRKVIGLRRAVGTNG